MGLQAITTTMPSIKYMSSIYLGEVEEGGGREFSTDPLAPELFNYPRITSGFVNNEASNFNQNSLSLYSGIWTHFIHPDDVFQVNQRTEDDFRSRNPLGLGWKSDEERDYGLYDVFKQRLEETKQRFPFTRFITAREAGPIVQRWVNTQTYYEEQKKQLHVTGRSIKQGLPENKQKFWFAYVNDKNSNHFEDSLAASDIDFRKSPLWQGSLYQFKSSADTLRVPLLRASNQENNQLVSRAINRYQQFMNPPDSVAAANGQWRDTRLQDALAALSNNPNAKLRQENVIELAVEFDSVGVAISILERRLMSNSSWDTEDSKRLIKFYGWQNAAPRAYDFAEKLWNKYQNKSVLRFNDTLTAQLGIPSQAYQERWLRRAYRLNPDDSSILKQLVTNADSWENRKKYLTELIAANPHSDSLYAYAIQQSIGNAGSAQTIELLQSFPDSQYVDQQLRPYADQIAYRYAEQNELTRAGMWAQRSNDVPQETQLSWLLQQERYQEFLDRSELISAANAPK
ncbi:MAG: DUF2194 domain-containing protein [Fodinibius sp.]|nr:DUF2194 domain-containing protein [Fodinibius sp.]